MRILLYDPRTHTIERGSEELLERWRTRPETIVWLDFDTVSDEHRQRILEGEFGLHPLAIQDALRQRHPPKVERFEHVLHIRSYFGHKDAAGLRVVGELAGRNFPA